MEANPAQQESESTKGRQLGCGAWAGIVVGGFLAVSLISSMISANAMKADEAATQELNAQLTEFGQALDQQCFKDLLQSEPRTKKLWTWESQRSDTRVMANGAIFDENNTRKLVTCNYEFGSMEEPNFKMTSITVSNEAGTESKTYTSEGSEVSEATNADACGEAFSIAAGVPAGGDVNALIAKTGEACATVDEWWAAVKQYPGAFAQSYYPDSERWMYLSALCTVAPSSKVCSEAKSSGMLSAP